MTVVWRASMETTPAAEFTDTSQAVFGTFVTTPDVGSNGPSGPRQGTKFLQTITKNGQQIISGGERCDEIQGGFTTNVEGGEYWHGMSTFYPSSWPAQGISAIEWHSNSGALYQGQACIQVSAAPNNAGANFGYTNANPGLILFVNGGDPNQVGQYSNINTLTGGLNGHPYTSMGFDLGPMTSWRGFWIDMLLHVVWSSTGVGTVELWMKPATTFAYTKYVSMIGNISNNYVGAANYLKLPNYRNANSGLADGYIFYDATTVATTRAEADPAVLPLTPATSTALTLTKQGATLYPSATSFPSATTFPGGTVAVLTLTPA